MSNNTYVFPTVVIDSFLTFTAKRWGQFPTISFTNGATAGSEVVSVDSSLNITVQIASGVSTNLQIKTAIDATAGSLTGLSAGDLVSVAITGGHNSDTHLTVKNAALAGGTALTKSSLTIGHLVFQAQTGGTAGNSIRIKYTSGGSLSVSVSSSDITIQLKNDGSSTNALIKAAVDASSPAHALVSVASDGLAMSFVPTVAMASAFLNLSGGTAAVAPFVVLQDLTITSLSTGIAANGKTVTYTTGATAGAEVVTVVSGNVNVQIQNGVSTATQINAALGAAGAFTALYAATISGTGSTAQKTINGALMTGAVGPNDLSFYVDNTITALTSSFVFFPFNNVMRNFNVYNDETSGAKTVIFSFDGTNISGQILPTENAQLFDINQSGVFLKYGSGAPVYRVFATGPR